MMRITELEGKPVRTRSGKSLGHVFEIHADNEQITTLVCGVRGFLQRMFRSATHQQIEWTRVARITATEIVLKD
jgi:sporulation protein YlmC with PRC-barrel domain